MQYKVVEQKQFLLLQNLTPKNITHLFYNFLAYLYGGKIIPNNIKINKPLLWVNVASATPSIRKNKKTEMTSKKSLGFVF